MYEHEQAATQAPPGYYSGPRGSNAEGNILEVAIIGELPEDVI